jgi:hypothetical protein
VELLVKFLGCTDVVGMHLLLTPVGCSTRILPLVVLGVLNRTKSGSVLMYRAFLKKKRIKKRIKN